MKRIPCATYRVQFHGDFTLRHAGEILDYLAELGISDVYASPLLEAGAESTHGYDTCCFGKLNSNLGSFDDFERFTGALKDRELGLLLDFVPNHMSATPANAWWSDVLEKGRGSAYAEFFDIHWKPENRALRGKVLLPILEDHYGTVLESGKLRLTFRNGNFFLSYYKRHLPVDRATIPAEAFNNPEGFLGEINGQPGDARSFLKLDALIERQHYRLAYWRAAAAEINYRRFFDVTEMAAIRMELPEVFKAAHELIFEWLRTGKITGLRIDHPDGLWDPKQYFERLQSAAAELRASGKILETGQAMGVERPLYVAVEKILCGDERLPKDWAVDGTTGYEFLNRVNGLFVNGLNALALQEIYREFTGNKATVEEIGFQSRKQVLERTFASEVNTLTCELREIARRTPAGRDFTFSELRRVMETIAASFPVYRTYVAESTTQVSAQDRKVIEGAMRLARERVGPENLTSVLDFVETLLLLKPDETLDEEGKKSAREFVMRFQQLTGPATAKGLEDTAFYRFNRLVSLNEVGGDLEKFGVTPEEFHAANGGVMDERPHAMLATMTHDAKRGEDLRARINVLSELLFEWRDAARRWSRSNREKKTMVQGAPAPDTNDEYLFYQMLVGAWPVQDDRDMLKTFRPRLTEFMEKAVKEAKVHTSWTEPNAEYEKALREFIERVLADDRNTAFIEDARRLAGRIGYFGRFNSLSQTLLKMTSPGVPDFYQGSELWDLSLVDPDNRRAVDYASRQRLLIELKKKYEGSQGGGVFFSQILLDQQPGAMKLFLIWRTLNFRKTNREVFERGNYVPLMADGKKGNHVCAFARVWREKEYVVVVPRLVFGLTNGAEVLPIGGAVWKDTVLPLRKGGAGTYRNVFTQDMLSTKEHADGAALELGQVFKQFPVALLEKI